MYSPFNFISRLYPNNPYYYGTGRDPLINFMYYRHPDAFQTQAPAQARFTSNPMNYFTQMYYDPNSQPVEDEQPSEPSQFAQFIPPRQRGRGFF